MVVSDTDLKRLLNFYKGIRVKGKTTQEIYNLFYKYRTLKGMPEKIFEIGSWKLGRSLFLGIAANCKEYYKQFGETGYDKYCKNYPAVTREFYEYVTEYKYLDEEPHAEVAESICKNPTEFEKLFYIPEPPKIPEPAFQPLKTMENPIVIRKSKNKKENFEKMLPVNWGVMTTGERIEFSMTVKNNKFLGYIYSIEPSIKDFVRRAQKENPKQKDTFDLYVSIFKFPPNLYPDNFKNLIRELVEKLNEYGRANLQYVECSYPPMIEIREVR